MQIRKVQNKRRREMEIKKELVTRKVVEINTELGGHDRKEITSRTNYKFYKK